VTDGALQHLAEKKVREALAKNPKEPKRVLAALLAAVTAALAKEN
jgi:hypothetical protein